MSTSASPTTVPTAVPARKPSKWSTMKPTTKYLIVGGAAGLAALGIWYYRKEKANSAAASAASTAATTAASTTASGESTDNAYSDFDPWQYSGSSTSTPTTATGGGGPNDSAGTGEWVTDATNNWYALLPPTASAIAAVNKAGGLYYVPAGSSVSSGSQTTVKKVTSLSALPPGTSLYAKGI